MQKNCLRCGGEIIRGAKANNKKYCSSTCRDTAWGERNSEKMKEYQRNRYYKKIKGETVPCAVCGRNYRQVGTHIVQVHKMTAREYRKKYGFDVKRGQLPTDLKKLKGSQVFENGTVKNLEAGKKFHFVKGQSVNYQRSPQTMQRLKQQSFIKKNN